MLSELLKDQLQMLFVLFWAISVHHDVIQKYKDKLALVFLKDFIHHPLKGGRCIGEPKTHDCPYKESF